VIKIGSYNLDQEEMTLSLDGTSVKLEPKVLAVLTYFYQNENRYISMAELHEKVWQDRCVSDAAVRRVIGKLRSLFNDDHKAPNYIQSLPKRGYKLICQISVPSDIAKTAEVVKQQNSQVIPPPAKMTTTSAPTVNHKKSNDDENLLMGLVARSLRWGNKTLLLLLLSIIAFFFIGPLVYRITALIS